ncbi:MAG TPA: GNAT family N-acetyltransferase [Pseudonocardiaceae bacterium]
MINATAPESTFALRWRQRQRRHRRRGEQGGHGSADPAETARAIEHGRGLHRGPKERGGWLLRERGLARVEKVVVPAPGITFQLLNGTQAAAHVVELQALHAEVYAKPPYGLNDDATLFADRFRVQCRQPGFVLADARHGGYLVGYAFGMPLRPSTSWWRDLTTPLPGEVTTEYPGRTFALLDLLVRASWRRQGIARTLHDLILRTRPEERATLIALPAATPAQNAFQKWGWRKVARTGDARRGSPVYDVLVRYSTA